MHAHVYRSLARNMAVKAVGGLTLPHASLHTHVFAWLHVVFLDSPLTAYRLAHTECRLPSTPHSLLQASLYIHVFFAVMKSYVGGRASPTPLTTQTPHAYAVTHAPHAHIPSPKLHAHHLPSMTPPPTIHQRHPPSATATHHFSAHSSLPQDQPSSTCLKRSTMAASFSHVL